MEEKAIYIKNIIAKDVRNLSGLEIDISHKKRAHLILTGKNGSGKTTLLNEINLFLNEVALGKYAYYETQKINLESFEKKLTGINSANEKNTYSAAIKGTKSNLNKFGGVEIIFSEPEKLIKNVEKGNFVVAFFNAKRLANLEIPAGIKKVSLKDKYGSNDKVSSKFLQYIVNLRAEKSFARDDNETDRVLEIDEWFNNFEARLGEILSDPQITLKFDRQNYNFLIISQGKEPYTLAQLSDGHSAILSILTELIMRMESLKPISYNTQGIVLIDEIEMHLHVELQKMILPFLIEFFPNIQFILTTHSPFVLSSVPNTVVCDLETGETLRDLSGYSYDALIESYFQSDQYSSAIKTKVDRYGNLSNRERTVAEEDEYLKLQTYFEKLPMNNSPELKVKLQQIWLSNLEVKKEQ